MHQRIQNKPCEEAAASDQLLLQSYKEAELTNLWKIKQQKKNFQFFTKKNQKNYNNLKKNRNQMGPHEIKSKTIQKEALLHLRNLSKLQNQYLDNVSNIQLSTKDLKDEKR